MLHFPLRYNVYNFNYNFALVFLLKSQGLSTEFNRASSYLKVEKPSVKKPTKNPRRKKEGGNVSDQSWHIFDFQ